MTNFLNFTKTLIKRYLINSCFVIFPQIISIFITLITLPIFLANLSIKEYGIFQFVLALQIWLTSFSAANTTTASKRGIAKGLDGTFIHAFLARLKLLVPVGILVLATAFYFKIADKEIFPILLTISGLYLIFGYLFQISFYEFLIAKKRFRQWCFWQSLISSVSSVGSAATAYFTKSIVYFALFQLGSVSALGLIAWLWIVKKEALIKSYKNGEIDKECVPYGLKLIPADLVTITAGRISHFMIGSFWGFASLAIFSVANKLRDKCSEMIKNTRLLLYADFAKIEREELTKIINRHLAKIGTLGIVLTLGFISAGWFYIKIFLPEPFHQAMIYFAILASGLPAGVMVIILHTFLESHLRHKELIVIGIVANLLRLLLIVVFGYFGQVIGVCIALAIGLWITFAFYYSLALKGNVWRDLCSMAAGLKKHFSWRI